MIKGFISGGIWGLITGVLVLGVASLLGQVPGTTPPAAEVVEVPAGSEFQAAGQDVPVDLETSEDAAPGATESPMVVAPDAPPPPTLSDDVTTSAGVPETGEASELAPPPETPDSSGVVVLTEGIALEEPAPLIETAPDVPTEGPQEPVTPTAGAEAPTGPAAEAPVPEAVVIDGVAVLIEAEETPEVQTTQPDPLPQEPADTVPVPEEEPEPQQSDADLPVATAPTPAEPELDALKENVAPVPDAEQTEPEAPVVTEPAEVVPEPTPPAVAAGGIRDRAENVETGRLPTVGAKPAESALPERAVDLYSSAASWAGPDDRPLIAFVLIDEGSDAKTFPALRSFDHPLTFVLPETSGAAVAAMSTYRAAGHEVLAMLDLPQGARASDAEVALEATLNTLDETVGVLDGSFAGFNGDRAIAEQVVARLKASGHGLVLADRGLNTAARIAAQEDVPAATIFRDLDAAGQDARVIGRFLDQAAFRAGQEGSVVLIARMRAETISALLIWQQQPRAERVNIAPLSAILTLSE